MKSLRTVALAAASLAAIAAFGITGAVAQQASADVNHRPEPGTNIGTDRTDSVGRGAPVLPMPNPNGRLNARTGEVQAALSTTNNLSEAEIAAGIHGGQGEMGGPPPEGHRLLPRDIFNSDDFYLDIQSGIVNDIDYYRCNSNSQVSYMWGAAGPVRLDPNDPYGTAQWGDCDVSYPREGIVSPYDFDTAQEHYEALMAEAEANGGLVHYDAANPPPDWTGRYNRLGNTEDLPQWYFGNIVQPNVYLTLLTPLYQQRILQEWYHAASSGITHWPSQYCWPEGFMRRFHAYAVRDWHFFMTPDAFLTIAGVAGNFLTEVLFDREFQMDGAVPRLGQDVPRWYGNTIGFWDGDVLVTWTSNIQGWMSHDQFEHSNKMQSVEIYTPAYGEDGEVASVTREAVLYDPDALAEPIRIVQQFNKAADVNDPDTDPYVFIECVQTIYPIDGRAQPLAPGAIIENYEVPDIFGRPWDHLFQIYEQDMQRPDESALFGF